MLKMLKMVIPFDFSLKFFLYKLNQFLLTFYWVGLKSKKIYDLIR